MIVAVYGTLKKGLRFHYFMDGATFLGHFVTPPKFTMVSAGPYPIVVTEGNTPITTEVYDVPEANMDGLYNLEGYYGPGNKRNLYDVTEIETPYGQATMFVMEPSIKNRNLEIIPTGIW